MRRDVQISFFSTKVYTSQYTKYCTNTSIEEAVNTYICDINFLVNIYAIYKCARLGTDTLILKKLSAGKLSVQAIARDCRPAVSRRRASDSRCAQVKPARG